MHVYSYMIEESEVALIQLLAHMADQTGVQNLG